MARRGISDEQMAFFMLFPLVLGRATGLEKLAARGGPHMARALNDIQRKHQHSHTAQEGLP